MSVYKWDEERERERECKLQPVQQLVSYKHKAHICKSINILKLSKARGFNAEDHSWELSKLMQEKKDLVKKI